MDRGEPGAAVPWLLHDLAIASSRIDVAIGDRLGLSGTDFLALKYVMVCELPLGPARLGQLLGISSGSATALVDRLEQAGHLERRAHATDRRRKVLAVTATTRHRVFTELLPVASALSGFVDSFSEAELAVVRRFLSGVVGIHHAADPGNLLRAGTDGHRVG
jgi:DNA-binding MarR family transcriptional regulator